MNKYNNKVCGVAILHKITFNYMCFADFRKFTVVYVPTYHLKEVVNQFYGTVSSPELLHHNVDDMSGNKKIIFVIHVSKDDIHNLLVFTRNIITRTII